jgi:hypothetical protein
MPVSDSTRPREPWNKGKLVGQKAPLKVRDIWAIRVRLQLQGRIRELAVDGPLYGAGGSTRTSRRLAKTLRLR